MTNMIIEPGDKGWVLPSGTEVSFTAAAALSRNTFTVAASLGGPSYDEFSDFSRLYRWERGSWIATEIEHYFTSIIPYRDPDWASVGYALLSQQGEVVFLGERPYLQKIEGAGYPQGRDAPVRYGPLNRVRLTGDHLYACGSQGQIYKKTGGFWQDDSALRHQAHLGERHNSVDHVGNRLGQPAFDFSDVASYDGTDFYACGNTRSFQGMLFWKNMKSGWTRLPSEFSANILSAILIEGPNEVWVCGSDSLLLRGSRTSGFQQVPADVGGLHLESMVRYQDRIYVGGSNGLLQLVDGRLIPCINTRPVSISPGVGRPKIDDCHVLQVVEGVLWNFGYQSIQRFDGAAWEEISIPTLVAD